MQFDDGSKKYLMSFYASYCLTAYPSVADLFCWHPAGGAVTLKVAVIYRSVQVPPECRNPSS